MTWEYPEEWERDSEPFYSINDDKNDALHQRYKKLTPANMVIGGRLGGFKWIL